MKLEINKVIRVESDFLEECLSAFGFDRCMHLIIVRAKATSLYDKNEWCSEQYLYYSRRLEAG